MYLFLGRGPIPLPHPHRIELYAVEYQLQLLRRDTPVRHRTFTTGIGHLKCPSFETFVQTPVPVALPPQHFQLVPAAVRKDKQASVVGRTLQKVRYFSTQSVNRFSHVRQSSAQVDRRRRRQSKHVIPSAPPTICPQAPVESVRQCCVPLFHWEKGWYTPNRKITTASRAES